MSQSVTERPNRTSDERRNFRRLPFLAWVTEEHGAATYFHRAADLSVGGIHIPGTIGHQNETVVQLHLQLPGEDESISISAEVVAGDPAAGGMHLRFVDLDDAQRARLREAVELLVASTDTSAGTR